MLIDWKKDGINIIPTTAIDEDGVDNSKIRARIFLTPGINEITKDEFKRIKPHIKDLIGSEFVILSKEGSLKDMPNKKAKELIEKCDSIATLKYWLEREKRADVRAKIDELLKELKDVPVTDVSAPVPDEEPEEEDEEPEEEDEKLDDETEPEEEDEDEDDLDEEEDEDED